ncbi:MAG: carboxypeptidase regulatory-like domain-containing protein [Acidobacteria bacterium]|nr:carboxypeptidase regulatory-like domain-containing protein [Acidobacteriota bacterium]
MVKKIWAVSLFCMLLALGARPAVAQFGQMTGNVIGEDGQPAANIVISIDREDIKGHYEVKTDKNGKFFHAGLPLGRFTVTIIKDGKQLFSQGNVQTRMAEPVNVSINLREERARTEAEAAGVEIPAEQGGRLTEEQMKAIEELAKQKDEAIKKRQELMSKFGAAMEAMKNKDYDTAIPTFQAASEVDPTQHVIFAQLGEAYSGKAGATRDAAQKKEFYTKSTDAYKKAMELKADDASYHNNYALALVNLGQVEEAQGELMKAAQMDAANAGQYYFNLGAVLQNTNHMKEASDAFRKATEAKPDLAEAYYRLGTTLSNQASMAGDKVVWMPGTKEAMEKYLELAPTGPYAGEAKALLDAMAATVPTSVGGATPAAPPARR